jgi:hypothetical protein
MSEMHMVPSQRGRICREWLAIEGGSNSLLVEEEGNGVTWLLIYGWDAGWEVEGVFRMGSVEDYADEVIPRFGRIVAVGESDPGGEEILVVEEGMHGFWVLVYEWSFFWEMWMFEVGYYVSHGRYIHHGYDEEIEDEEDDTFDEDEVLLGNDDVYDEDEPSLSDHDYLEL